LNVLLAQMVLVQMVGNNVGNSLSSILEILVNGAVVGDAHPDDGQGNNQGTGEKNPVGDELIHEADLAGVKRPHDGGTSRLNALVQSDVVGSTATRVGKCTHIPIDSALPEAVIHAIEDVKEHGANVARSGPVISGGVSTGIGSLESIATTVDDEGNSEEEAPSDLGADTTTEVGEIKTPAHNSGTEDLGEVVKTAVESLGTSVEVGAIDCVLLVDIEPVGREDHGKEENDPGIASNGFVEVGSYCPSWELRS